MKTNGYPEPGAELLPPWYGVKFPPPVPLLWISPNCAPICGVDIASKKHEIFIEDVFSSKNNKSEP